MSARRLRQDDPRKWPVEIDADGARHATLPDDYVLTYDEEKLAEMCVELIHRAQTDPASVDDHYYETLRHLAGEQRWRQAIEMVAALT
jgi:hypothetical protein